LIWFFVEMRLESFGAVEGVVIPVRSLSAFGRVGEGVRVDGREEV
jgi:hypothetical protein